MKVFVSGCYDILHGGHVEFFSQARALGDYLIVSFASDAVLAAHKHGRRSSIPTEHKRKLIGALRMVDEVVVGEGHRSGLDFEDHFLRIKPQLLVATEDDKYSGVKRELCAKASVGAEYVILPKTLGYTPVSTSQILAAIRAPERCPLRVDFGGGWLDVPKHAREGAFIVNCAITPMVALDEWGYHIGGGLGGSAAYALLRGCDAVQSELDLGVGWQDPAVIRESGLCVWRSGAAPALDCKTSGALLRGRMALLWTGAPHVTPEKTDVARNYDLVEAAGRLARTAVLSSISAALVAGLAAAVAASCEMQELEGMAALPRHGELARKYCGGGWGGYALYLFGSAPQRDDFVARVEGALSIEPYLSSVA
ncbi:cytidyltransferase-related domain-containing protein [Tribonema minus]|uniref:Cytidyltransferase-related domain-containing protein n=1 Tax=Tribonema minus TaxID=303371 RepID=A0A835ZF91_9STRA|nr:cytidyltransferase-related domain-containing protein [Tribonema minus]